MGFTVKLRETLDFELIRENRYVRMRVPFSESAPGEVTITLPAALIPEILTAYRALAVVTGQPMKASWDAEYIAKLLDASDEDIGRPTTPSRYPRSERKV